MVDDHDDIRLLTVEQLSKNMPHEVIAADSMSTALIILNAEPTIGLVVTDYQMPNGSGLDLLEQIRFLNIEVPVVVVTGYPLIAKEAEQRRFKPNAILSKPVNFGNLICIAKSHLDSESKTET